MVPQYSCRWQRRNSRHDMRTRSLVCHLEIARCHQTGEDDQALEQPTIVLDRARVEVRIHHRVDERDQEFVLVADRFDFVIRVEYLALVKPKRLDDARRLRWRKAFS